MGRWRKPKESSVGRSAAARTIIRACPIWACDATHEAGPAGLLYPDAARRNAVPEYNRASRAARESETTITGGERNGRFTSQSTDGVGRRVSVGLVRLLYVRLGR